MLMDPEMLARLVFCFENNPERHDGIISGAQDSIGICVPGLVPFLIISIASSLCGALPMASWRC